MQKFKISISSDLGSTDFYLKASTNQEAISKSLEISDPTPGEKLSYQILDSNQQEIYSTEIDSYDNDNVWEWITKFRNQQQQEKKLYKMMLIKKWIKQNVKRNRPTVGLDDIGDRGTIIDNRYIFFFKESPDGISLKSVLKRVNMKRAANWMINGQAGKNTKQLYWSN